MRRALQLSSVVLAFGSVYGLIGLLQLISNGAVVTANQKVVAFLAALLFLWTGVAAILVYRGVFLGLVLCELALLFQVLWVDAPTFAYHAMAGPYLFLVRFGNSGAPLFGVGGSFSIQFGTESQVTGWAVNIVALLLLGLFELARRRRELRGEAVAHHPAGT